MFHDRWPGFFSRPDIDRLFEHFLRGEGRAVPANRPRVNIRESDDAFVVEAEVPGVDPKELGVNVEGDTLVLTGERPPADAKTPRRERWTGSFRRELALATPIDADHVEARFEEGLLSVRLPKATEAQPRLIEIQTN